MKVVAVNPITGADHAELPPESPIHVLLKRLDGQAKALTIHHANGADVRYEVRS